MIIGLDLAAKFSTLADFHLGVSAEQEFLHMEMIIAQIQVGGPSRNQTD